MSRKKNKNRIVRQNNAPQIQQAQRRERERQLRILQETRFTSGPIPSAEEMARYGEVQADLPDRIMRQFERQTDMARDQHQHRIRQEDRVVGNNILMERLGWVSSTIFGLLVIGGSLGLIYQGKSLVGFSGVLIGLGTLLGVYVTERRRQVQDLSKKRAAEMLINGVTPEQLELLPEE